MNRQVLAEPDAVLATKTWASLEDGTPLVTGEHRGKGVVSLFHVGADMRWSDLPMSGSFVEMLRRMVDMSGYTSTPGAGVAGETAKVETVAPLRTLDGFGAFGPPPSTAKPMSADYRDRATRGSSAGLLWPGRRSDRGQYAGGGRSHRAARYLQPARAARQLHQRRTARFARHSAVVVAGAVPDRCDRGRDAGRRPCGLAGGGAQRPRRVALALILAATAIAPSPARAESNDEFAIKAVTQTRLAYVVTGNADVDSIVKAGMAGLTLFLAQRTALEAGDPVGVDPTRDELAFFPLIYWPVVPGAPKPPQDAINRIDAYMKQGGTVVFDTRDAIEAPPGENGASQTPGMRRLRDILSSLDVPELEPVPREHVLTKTFYLLRDFPGRFNIGQTWVEALPREDDDEAASRPARGGDGVSPIIITSNDLAGAWAHTPGRSADAAADAGRTAPARIRLPRRRQHRDVHADRQLQGRPGSRTGPDRTARAIGPHMQYGIAFTPLVPTLVLWIALAAIAVDRGSAAARPGARRGGARRGAGADPAGAGQSLLYPRGPRAAVLGRRRRDRQEPEPEFRHSATRKRRKAREALVDRLKKIKGLEVRVVEAGQADGETDGTKLFGALSSALSDVPVDRVAGAFLITDGRVHDIPANAAALGFQAPVHALVTGRKDERDRRIAISAAPRFGIVGQPQTITYRLDDQGVTGQRAKIVVRRDGEVISERTLMSGQTSNVEIDIKHAGPNIVEIEASPLRERTDAGEQPRRGRDRRRARQAAGAAGFRRTAFRRAYLAQPLEVRCQRRPRAFHHSAPAGKAGRHADQRIVADRVSDARTVPAEDQRVPVDHLRPLRPPGRAADRLFRQHRALCPRRRRGAGFGGPDYASTTSIWRTPLDSVLPAEPVGVTEKPFHAHLSDAGKRHPVTRGLEGSASEPPHWSRFFRTVETRNAVTPPVMTGADGKPLLLLSRFGEGRVALAAVGPYLAVGARL